MAFTTGHLHQVLSGWPVPSRYRVALSGGLDSTVLLYALAALRDTLDAPLGAVHVNHGLQGEAPQWAAHCAHLCSELHLPLETLEVTVPAAKGASPEAAARDARYRALADTLQPGELLLLAHHQDDQAETLLLQLLRGAGVAGLAAMPALTEFGSGSLGRPLLDVGRDQLADYAMAHRLSWVEDPSNRLLDFDRNYLRQQVVPLLKARWPAASATLSRSAGHCAAADRTLRALAAGDLAACRQSPWRVAIGPFTALPAERQYNLLRAWIDDVGLPTPPARKLERVLSEMLPARQDAEPLVAWPGAELRRHRDSLWLMPPLADAPDDWQAAWEGDRPVPLPAGLGELHAVPGQGGIDRDRWTDGEKQLLFRRDGLRCTPAGRQGSRPLKKLFQELGVPSWLRGRVPLLLIDGELAAVGDCCVCEPFAAAGEGMRLHWQRDAWLDAVRGDTDAQD